MRSVVALILGTILVASSAMAAEAGDALFGRRGFREDSLVALPAWQGVLARLDAERPLWRACAERDPACPSRAGMAWQALLRGLAGEPPERQLREVNRFANSWAYRADREVWGRSDYWATPLEFLRRSGDCEDYVILKYVSLRQLGFAADRLRLVVVRDSLRGLVHAVLAVRLGGETLILDNLADAILPDRRLVHYEPYYSANETARWAHVGVNALVVSGAAAR
ncbi:MAG: transglutaminase-like cysteine peptidase [Geminicoccaceae bacterium]